MEPAAGIEANFLDEPPAGLPIHLEGLRLPPGAVQGEHQLRRETLTQRVGRHECLELRDKVGVAPEGKVGIDSLLESGELQRFDAGDLGPCERFRREVDERGSAPESEA